MMRFSIYKNSEVPLGEQLRAQVILAVVSRELPPKQKMPSTRELSRRLGIHANTVSAVYRDLVRRGWLEFRAGSGNYVRELKGNRPLEGCLELDHMISAFLKLARERGFSLEAIKNRARLWLELQPPDHLLLVDPDEDLRHILRAEIEEAVSFPVKEISLRDLAGSHIPSGAAPVALYGLAEEVRALLSLDTQLFLLHTQPVAETIETLRKLKPGTFIIIASSWSGFLRWARNLLLAGQVSPDLLSFRDAREKGWQTRFPAQSFIIADVITASSLSARHPSLVFRIISKESLQALREYVREFLPASQLPQKP